MSVNELLTELAARGLRLSVCGDKLRVKGPPSELTEELRFRLAAHKPALVVSLNEATHQRLLEVTSGWPRDWLERWKEGVTLLERESGLSRAMAEEWAFHALLSLVMAAAGVAYEPLSIPTVELLGRELIRSAIRVTTDGSARAS